MLHGTDTVVSSCAGPGFSYITASMPTQDDDVAADMGRQAREHVQANFSRAKFGAALETIVRKMLV
jgi:hypothetical protein